MKILLLSLLGGVVGRPAVTSPAAESSCAGQFSKVASSDWVSRAHPGWNLGNTLEAVPTEGSWNNPPVDFSTFDDIKAAGFKSIRIPGRRILLHMTLAKLFSDVGGSLHLRIARLDD